MCVCGCDKCVCVCVCGGNGNPTAKIIIVVIITMYVCIYNMNICHKYQYNNSFYSWMQKDPINKRSNTLSYFEVPVAAVLTCCHAYLLSLLSLLLFENMCSAMHMRLPFLHFSLSLPLAPSVRSCRFYLYLNSFCYISGVHFWVPPVKAVRVCTHVL